MQNPELEVSSLISRSQTFSDVPPPMAPSFLDTPRSLSSNFKAVPFSHEDDIPVRLLMSGDLVGRLIGRGGGAIKQIRELSRANVAVLEKETPAPIIALNERIVKITGNREARDLALRLILHKIKEFSLNEMTGQKMEEWIDMGSHDPLAGLNDSVSTSLCLIVPDQACSNIIGSKGDALKKLSEDSGACIQIPREGVLGYSGQRRVQISGTIRDVRSATLLVHGVMKEMHFCGQLKSKHFDLPLTVSSTPVLQPPASGLASVSPNILSSVLNPAALPFTSQMHQSPLFPTPGYSNLLYSPFNGMMTMPPPGETTLPIRIVVSKEEAAWVVGKKGAKIQKLREDMQVNVNIDEACSPPFHKSDRLITITGPTAAKHNVMIFILSDLEKQRTNCETLRLLIPADSFGIIMGKRGEQMKKITIATNANIQKTDPGPGGMFSLAELQEDAAAANLSQTGDKVERTKRSKVLITLGGKEGTDQTQYRLLLITGDDKQRTRAALMIVQLLDQRAADDANASRHSSHILEAAQQASGAGISMTSNEAMLMQLAASTGTTTQRPVRMQILIPSLSHLTFLMGPGGQGADLNMIGKRAGCEIQLGGTVPDAIGNGSGFPVLILSGSAVGNAFAFLLIQERLLAMEMANSQDPFGVPRSNGLPSTTPKFQSNKNRRSSTSRKGNPQASVIPTTTESNSPIV